MSKEVTIVTKDNHYVRLGLLQETGRIYYRVRILEGGMMEPANSTTEILRNKVDLLDGYRFDLLREQLEQLLHAQGALQWQAERQQTVAELTATAEAKVERQVGLAIKRWEREHPRPTGNVTESVGGPGIHLASEGPEPPIWEAEPTVPDGPDDPRTPLDSEGRVTDRHSDDNGLESAPVTAAWSPAVGDQVIVKDNFELGKIRAITDEPGEVFDIYVQLDDTEGVSRFVADELELVEEE